MKSIGIDAFFGCSSLTSITIPESVTSIGWNAFSGCSSLTSITIPEGVTSIGRGAFQNCSSLTSIIVEKGNTVYDSRGDCNAIIETSTNTLIAGCSTTTIPENVASIGNYAFFGCSGLTSITLPESVTSIGEYAFRGCSGLTSITIPEGVTSIEDDAFYGCSSLTSITLPESVTSIGDYAFYNCSSLTSITISEGVTSIGNDAFSGCSSLTSIIVEKGNTVYDSRGDCNAIIETSTNTLIAGCSTTTIPESVTSIGFAAFADCSSLTSITIPESVTSIGSYAFQNCSSLTSITIPESVTSIGYHAFYGCSSLTSIIVEKGNTVYDSRGDCNAIIETSTNTLIVGCSTTTIPENVASIGSYAFYNCSSLESITIPEGVTSIGYRAFSGCTGELTVNCNIPSASNSNEGTFCNSKFTNVTIGDNVTSIGNYAFDGCTSLKEVILEDGSKTLTLGYNFYYSSGTGQGLFYDCPLENVYMGRNLSYNSGKSYGYSPFYNKTQLKTLTIGENVTSVRDYAFYGCSSLTSITLPEGVTSIGSSAFYNCSNITELTLGSNVSSIGSSAFAGCNDIESIYTLNTKAITCDESIFSTDAYNNAILYTPTDRVFAYEKTTPWSKFQIEPMGEFTVTYMVDGKVYETKEVEYASKIPLIDEPVKEGYTFSGWSEAPETMPANDVTISGAFTVNKYLVTFKIGDEVIVADSLEYGAAIVAPEAPEKEGYTFIGWGEVAETVPANDLTYEGSYSVNSYLLTYTVDGETLQSDSVAYGTVITLLDEPAKEGYTFSGWSEAPETMPAEDVTIGGTFTVNKYLVTFKIGDEVIAADSLEYGATIVAPEAPEKEGYTFDGWGEVVETVPASDVTCEGTYTVNIYKVYYYVGEELVHTAEVAYGEAIPEYIYEPTGEGDVFEGWVGDTYEAMPAHDVTYTANIESGIEDTEIKIQNSEFIYDLTGRKVVDTENLKGGIYIVNGKKVVLR